MVSLLLKLSFFLTQTMIFFPNQGILAPNINN